MELTQEKRKELQELVESISEILGDPKWNQKKRELELVDIINSDDNKNLLRNEIEFAIENISPTKEGAVFFASKVLGKKVFIRDGILYYKTRPIINISDLK